MGDVESAGRLSEDGHILWVAAEDFNLTSDPEQRCRLVEQTLVAICAQDGCVHPAEDAQPVVERHHDHVAGHGQFASVDARLGPGTDRVAAAVNPDHHRPLAVVAGGRPDIEIETILGLRLRGNPDQITDIPCDLPLHRRVREPGGVADAVPRIHRFGRSPTKIADRRLGEGNPSKDNAAVVLRTLEFAESSRDLRRHDRRPPLVTRDGSMVAPARNYPAQPTQMMRRSFRSWRARAFGPPVKACNCSTCRGETVLIARATYHWTGSLNGAAVSEPV